MNFTNARIRDLVAYLLRSLPRQALLVQQTLAIEGIKGMVKAGVDDLEIVASIDWYASTYVTKKDTF